MKTEIELFKSGISIDITAAKRKALEIALETIRKTLKKEGEKC
jgi:hypothetical protein